MIVLNVQMSVWRSFPIRSSTVCQSTCSSFICQISFQNVSIGCLFITHKGKSRSRYRRVATFWVERTRSSVTSVSQPSRLNSSRNSAWRTSFGNGQPLFNRLGNWWISTYPSFILNITTNYKTNEALKLIRNKNLFTKCSEFFSDTDKKRFIAVR